MTRLTSKEITNHVIAYNMTDNPRIKRYIFEIVNKSMEGYVVGRFKTIVSICGWEELEDFKSFCAIHILDAMRRFDPGRNCRFGSYAVWYINHARNLYTEQINNVKLSQGKPLDQHKSHKKSVVSLNKPLMSNRNQDTRKTLGDCLLSDQEKEFEFDLFPKLKKFLSKSQVKGVTAYFETMRAFGRGPGGKMQMLTGMAGLSREMVRQQVGFYTAMANNLLYNDRKILSPEIKAKKAKRYTPKKEFIETSNYTMEIRK